MANAWLKSDDEIKENPYFMGDYGLQYQTDAVISSHNPLSAFKLVATSQDGQETIWDIIRTLKGNHAPRITTKYDVLLFREGKYWKAVNVAFDDEDGIQNSPQCFISRASWGVSVESLERYCSNLMVVTDDEPKGEKVKRWKKMRFEDKLKLHEVIEREHLKN